MKTGLDEFCINCMDWREYDESGLCIICKKRIKSMTITNSKDSYDELKTETPSVEYDDECVVE